MGNLYDNTLILKENRIPSDISRRYVDSRPISIDIEKHYDNIEKEIGATYEMRPRLIIHKDKYFPPRNEVRDNNGNKIVRADIIIPRYMYDYNKALFIIVLRHEARENLLFQHGYNIDEEHEYAEGWEVFDIEEFGPKYNFTKRDYDEFLDKWLDDKY